MRLYLLRVIVQVRALWLITTLKSTEMLFVKTILRHRGVAVFALDDEDKEIRAHNLIRTSAARFLDWIGLLCAFLLLGCALLIANQ
ncbi:hypothetical protein [Microvirga soli]|uniref:hypothetical protein n=1 Tax=Microvirga soli TaxID=1854496 RepID=UPI00191FA000|nr:hypothetical protein [Microvirga soli]